MQLLCVLHGPNNLGARIVGAELHSRRCGKAFANQEEERAG